MSSEPGADGGSTGGDSGGGADRPGGRRPSTLRVVVWVGVSLIAIWLIVSGVSGIVAKGG